MLEIRVADYLPESRSNGPGHRSVLWVQGCPKRCPSCWNPDFLPSQGGTVWTIDEALQKLTQSSVISGITLLGGEPFVQAHSLAILCKHLKAKGLSVMAYSGWTIAELRQMGNPQSALLDLCDLLIDGEYLESQAANLLWRGSKNQQVHFLTEKYAEFRSKIDDYHRDFELFIRDGKLVLTGDPPVEVLKEIQAYFPNV